MRTRVHGGAGRCGPVVARGPGPAGAAGVDANAAIATGRPDLVDRNGEVLAADIKTASLYGEPRNIIDPDEAAEAIVGVLPDLDEAALRKRLTGDDRKS